jgi:hypothetical protein
MPREYEDRVENLDDIIPDADLRTASRDLTSEDKQWAMFAHLGGVIGGYVIPVAGWFLVPLIVWMVKKDTSKFVDDQGKEALNFQLTMFFSELIAGAITAATCLGPVDVPNAFRTTAWGN